MSAAQWQRPEHDDLGLLDTPQADAGNDRELGAELASAAPRQWWNKATLYLGGGLLVVVGFLAGAEVQERYGTPAAATASGAGLAPGNRAGAGGFPGRLGGGGADSTPAANATTGTVKLVDGTTLYVEIASGDVITVRTNADTEVRVARSGTLNELKPGDTVTVAGQAGAEGTVTATTVTGQAE